MKLLPTLILLLFYTHSFAGEVSLPLGGKVKFDTKDWNIQETKNITGKNSLIFIHREIKDLHGILLDGSIKTQGDCSQNKSDVCNRSVPMGKLLSYQLIAQRFIGKDTYQNYVLAFNFDKSQEKKILPVLEKMKSQLEFIK